MAALQAMEAGEVASCHDASEGGLAVSVAEMLFNTGYGAQLDFDLTSELLFSETPGRLVVTVTPDHQQAFEDRLGEAAQFIGTVTAEPTLELTTTNGQASLEVARLQHEWEEALPCRMK